LDGVLVVALDSIARPAAATLIAVALSFEGNCAAIDSDVAHALAVSVAIAASVNFLFVTEISSRSFLLHRQEAARSRPSIYELWSWSTT